MGELALKQEDISLYEAYAAKYNEVTRPNFQQLKLMNKEGREGFGQWFVGRKYEGRNVSEPGDEIVKLIILDHYGQYSYYDATTNSNLCRSKMYKGMPVGLRGSKFDYECGKGCPHRASKNCKAQIITFCIAITKEGKEIPCQYYAKGASYMPVNDLIRNIPHQVISGHRVHLPLFGVVIGLGSREESNGDTIYNVPVFKITGLTPPDKLDEYGKVVNQITDYVKSLDEEQSEEGQDEEIAVTHDITVVADGVPQKAVSRREMEGVDDFDFAKEVNPQGGGDDDITSSINEALGL